MQSDYVYVKGDYVYLCFVDKDVVAVGTDLRKVKQNAILMLKPEVNIEIFRAINNHILTGSYEFRGKVEEIVIENNEML